MDSPPPGSENAVLPQFQVFTAAAALAVSPLWLPCLHNPRVSPVRLHLMGFPLGDYGESQWTATAASLRTGRSAFGCWIDFGRDARLPDNLVRLASFRESSESVEANFSSLNTCRHRHDLEPRPQHLSHHRIGFELLDANPTRLPISPCNRAVYRLFTWQDGTIIPPDCGRWTQSVQRTPV